MRVKIYQMNVNRDHHMIKFLGLESMKKSMGVDSVDSSLYHQSPKEFCEAAFDHGIQIGEIQ